MRTADLPALIRSGFDQVPHRLTLSTRELGARYLGGTVLNALTGSLAVECEVTPIEVNSVCNGSNVT